MIIPEELAIHRPKKELTEIINKKEFNDKVLFETESCFHNIKVIENEIGRFLHYNDTYQAGIINTSNYSGNLPYINYFLLPYFFRKNIKKVLLIGLGSGKIINDLFKLFSIEKFDIIDIEENILDIAKNFFNFKLNKKINFNLQDAIVFLQNTKTKYDLIIVDVANNDGIDERFISKDYLKSIKSHLKSNGIFISNLCSSADLENKKNIFYKELKTLYNSIFDYVKIYKGDYSDKIYYKCFFDIDERVIDITNLIFLSSNKPLNYNKSFYSDIKSFKSKFKNIDIESILSDLVK